MGACLMYHTSWLRRQHKFLRRSCDEYVRKRTHTHTHTHTQRVRSSCDEVSGNAHHVRCRDDALLLDVILMMSLRLTSVCVELRLSRAMQSRMCPPTQDFSKASKQYWSCFSSAAE